MQSSGGRVIVAADLTGAVVGLINHVWLVSISNEIARNEIGLRYVSHHWDKHPSWHLWFADCKGVFRMELRGISAADGYEWVSHFSVKYYPDCTEDAFHGLSVLEKLCRESEVIDTRPSDGRGDCVCHGITHLGHDGKFADLASGCGVPRTECIASIPEDFFLAGRLTLAYHAGKGSLVSMETLSRWLVTLTSDHTLMDGDGKPLATLHRGETDRDFPGYKITDELYRHFSKAWSLHHRYKGCRETTRRQPGVAFKTDGKAITAEISGEVERVIVQKELTCREGDSLPLIQDHG